MHVHEAVLEQGGKRGFSSQLAGTGQEQVKSHLAMGADPPQMLSDDFCPMDRLRGLDGPSRGLSGTSSGLPHFPQNLPSSRRLVPQRGQTSTSVVAGIAASTAVSCSAFGKGSAALEMESAARSETAEPKRR